MTVSKVWNRERLQIVAASVSLIAFVVALFVALELYFWHWI